MTAIWADGVQTGKPPEGASAGVRACPPLFAGVVTQLDTHPGSLGGITS
jgi:hypothetical protein